MPLRASPSRLSGQPRPRLFVWTTAVGASVFTPERREDKTHPGDRFCLCSDGLNKVVPDWEIESVLNRQQGPEPAAQQLLDLSLDRQATDNVSIIVIDHL